MDDEYWESKLEKIENRFRRMESEFDDLKRDLFRAEDRISNLESEVRSLERR